MTVVPYDMRLNKDDVVLILVLFFAVAVAGGGWNASRECVEQINDVCSHQLCCLHLPY